MTKYLTNRQAAQAMLDGKPLIFDRQNGMAICGMTIRPYDLDEPSTARLAPEVITRSITYPKPVSEPLEMGQRYWVPRFGTGDYCETYSWSGGKYCYNWLSRGLIHLTESDAIAHAKALIGGEG